MLQTSFLRKFPSINFVDWSPAFVSNSFGLKNNFTGDLFTYENLDTHSQHMVEIYKQRAQYVMPNTPQIMLSQTDSKSNTLEMLVENGPYSIDRLVKKCDESTFRQLLFNISKTVQFLVKKFGYFKLTHQMIRVSSSLNFIVWINENFVHSHRQYPLASRNPSEDCKVLIESLLDIFQSVTSNKVLQKMRKKLATESKFTIQRFKFLINNTNQQSCFRKKDIGKVPQFLRRRTSPNIQFCMVNSLQLPHTPAKKQSNFYEIIQTPPSNLGSYEEKKAIYESYTFNGFLTSPRRTHKYSHSGEVIRKNLQISPEQKNLKDHSVRQSQKSEETTCFMSSLGSSGKVKIAQTLKQIKEMQMTMVIGTPEITQKEVMINIHKRYSNQVQPSIAEDSHEEILTPAYEESKNFFDYESQFHNILKSQKSETGSQKSKTSFIHLQNELEKIFL